MKNRLVELLKDSHSEWLRREYDHETDKNINEYVADYLLANNVIAPYKVVDGDFTFDYGVVVYKHRFSINRSLDDYKETTLSKCIRMGVEYKYKTMAKDKLIAEMQILYKDENDKLQCLCEDLHDYTFEIKHKGNMRIYL